MKKILSSNFVVWAVNLWCVLIAPLIFIILLVNAVGLMNMKTAPTLLAFVLLYWFVFGSVALSYNGRRSHAGYIVKQYKNFNSFFQFLVAGIVIGLMLLLNSWIAAKLFGISLSRTAEFILLINSASCFPLVFFQYFLLPDEDI
jgi:hypothetical protein